LQKPHVTAISGKNSTLQKAESRYIIIAFVCGLPVFDQSSPLKPETAISGFSFP